MDTIDIHAVEQKLTDITVTPIPLASSKPRAREIPTGDLSNKWTYDSKAFNLPPQTQISPVITTTPAGSHHHRRQEARNSNSPAAVAASTYQQLSSAQQNAAAMAVIDPLLSTSQTFNTNVPAGMSKYAQLLLVLEEMGREIRPSYSGSRSSSERLKRSIGHARILVRECLMETEKSARS